MSNLVNPYVAGAPIHEEQAFFGRQDMIEWVAQELYNPATNSLVLFGQRRIGKTSLLLQLQRVLPDEVLLPVYFNLQDRARQPLGEMLASLVNVVARRVGLELSDLDVLNDRGNMFIRKFLPELYQGIEERCRPVFLFDEFDVIGDTTKAGLPERLAARALFPFLRRVMDEDPRPAFVFVFGRRAEDLSMDYSATLKASLAREVWVLDSESAEALVRQAEANDTLHFTDDAVARISSLTSCHPYMSQLLCQRIWERAYKGHPTAPSWIDVPEVEAAVSNALEAGDQAFAWLWNGMSPAEKIYAAALAGSADEGETIPEDEVIQVITAHAARLRTRDVERAPRYLVKRRVLERAGEQRYRFAVELFRRWVQWNRPLSEAKNELDRVEPEAEKIYELGRDFFHRGEWAIAIRYFRDALGRNPQHFRARLHLGESFLELGQTDEAVTELERVFEMDPDEARLPLFRALMAQGDVREKKGDDREALAAYTRAIQVSPNDEAAEEKWQVIWTRQEQKAFEPEGIETLSRNVLRFVSLVAGVLGIISLIFPIIPDGVTYILFAVAAASGAYLVLPIWVPLGVHATAYWANGQIYGLRYEMQDIRAIVGEDGSAWVSRRVKLVSTSPQLSEMEHYLMVPGSREEADEPPFLDVGRISWEDQSYQLIVEKRSATTGRLNLIVKFRPPLGKRRSIEYTISENAPPGTLALDEGQLPKGIERDFFAWQISRPTKTLHLGIRIPVSLATQRQEFDVWPSTEFGPFTFSRAIPEFDRVYDSGGWTRKIKTIEDKDYICCELIVQYPILGLRYVIKWIPREGSDSGT